MKIIRNIYFKIISTLTSIFGYMAGPMMHYLLSAIITVAFAYGYFSSVSGLFMLEFFILAMGIILPATVIFHALYFGALQKIGLHSVFKTVRRIEKKMDGSRLRRDLSLPDLYELLEDLTRLPVLRLFTPLIDEFFFLGMIFLANELYFELDVYKYILHAAILVLPMLMAYCFVTTDLYASVTRAHIRKTIFLRGGTSPEVSALSLKVKGLIQLIIAGVSVYIILKMRAIEIQDANHSGKVLIFSVLSIANIGIISFMLFYSVFQAIADLAAGAANIEQGENPAIFSGTSDTELVYLSGGLMRASQKLLSHQRQLEKTVSDRTAALEDKNQLLQDFRKSMIMELSLAADIQAGIYPKTEEWHGFKFNYLHRPLQPVSGDYFDVFASDESVMVIGADASGHGVPAALVTMAAKTAMLQAKLDSRGTADFLTKANSLLIERIHTQDYMTVFAALIERDGTVRYTNAAHPPAMLYRSETNKIEFLDTEGVFLGMIPGDEFNYEEKTLKMSKTDRLLIYTDGISEASSSSGEQFGEKRLADFFLEHARVSTDKFLPALNFELEKFMSAEPQRDDISVILISNKGT
ncbi:MAG: serine/threonine-protein phosphatase [Leptospiraceae bacterium]|nr:serine/threonine-protein phosphatase [Leptospiraceae bacterium]